MSRSRNLRRSIRLLTIGLIIGLGAYWLGSRYGQRNPESVDALRPSARTRRWRRRQHQAGPYRSGECPDLPAIITGGGEYRDAHGGIRLLLQRGAGGGRGLGISDRYGRAHPDEQSRDRRRADDRGDAGRPVALQGQADRSGHAQRHCVDPDRSARAGRSRRCRWAIRGICWWGSACWRSATPSGSRAR